MKAVLSQSKLLLTFLALIFSCTFAEHLNVKSGYKSRNPLVEACEARCVFKNDDNSWCYEVTPPALQIGWSWNQTYTTLTEDPYTKFYQLEAQPYADIQLYIQQLFDVRRLIYNEFTVDLTKFRYNYFFSVIFNNATEICPGMGYENEAIDLELTTSS